MNCCAAEETCAIVGATKRPTNDQKECKTCGAKGREVSRKTVLLMLKSDLLEPPITGLYRFCQTSECPTVYFEEGGTRVFTIADLRVVVGLKSRIDPIPVCYCFGFNESDFREEIASTGKTTIPDRISSLIREGLCACESRNPSGGCCLGEVNRTARRLQQEALQTPEICRGR